MAALSLQARSDGALKDTFVNIRDTGAFCTNLVSLPQAHQMHRTAAEFPSEVDEFEAVGLEKASSEVVQAPRVAGARSPSSAPSNGSFRSATSTITSSSVWSNDSTSATASI